MLNKHSTRETKKYHESQEAYNPHPSTTEDNPKVKRSKRIEDEVLVTARGEMKSSNADVDMGGDTTSVEREPTETRERADEG